MPDPENQTPAYASFASFTNYLDHLKSTTIPHRIDKTVMSHLNHGTRQALMSSLKFLGLVNKDDARPTQRLEKLVTATGSDRTQLFREMLDEGYPFLMDGSIDLSRATPAQLREKMVQAANIQGSTAEKAEAFFLAIAEQAGITLSPHLTKRKAKSNGGGGTVRRTRRQRKPQQDDLPPTDHPPAGNQLGNITQQLMSKFPSFDPAWGDDLKKSWFASFEELMKRTKEQ